MQNFISELLIVEFILMPVVFLCCVRLQFFIQLLLSGDCPNPGMLPNIKSADVLNYLMYRFYFIHSVNFTNK
jgi:hypothetical protein